MICKLPPFLSMKIGLSKVLRPIYATSDNEDRVKLDTGRRSALFERGDEGIILKGTFARLKISDELSDTLPLLSYLGITYRKNEVVNDVLKSGLWRKETARTLSCILWLNLRTVKENQSGKMQSSTSSIRRENMALNRVCKK